MFMRKSKYDDLVGQIFSGVKLVETRMVDKTSKKTGKEYRVRRLWVTADDINTLEIGTQSWNKMSFLKRLDKITTEWVFSYDEWVKEEDDVEIKVDSFEDTVKETVDEWYESWKKEQEIDYLYRATFDGKEMAQNHFEQISQIMRESNNMNVAGQTIYHSKEEYFKHWNDFTIENVRKDLQEEVDLGDYKKGFVWNWAFKVAELNEWITEFSKKLWDFIESEWENMEERRRKAQKDWRDRMFGTGWEERWERRNFSSTISYEVNEYDEKFKDCKTVKDVKRVYRQLAKMTHSDTGGSDEEFIKVKKAYDRALSLVA